MYSHLVLIHHSSWSDWPDDSHLLHQVSRSLSSMRAGRDLLPGGTFPPQPWDKPHQSHADIGCSIVLKYQYLIHHSGLSSSSLSPPPSKRSLVWEAGLEREQHSKECIKPHSTKHVLISWIQTDLFLTVHFCIYLLAYAEGHAHSRTGLFRHIYSLLWLPMIVPQHFIYIWQAVTCTFLSGSNVDIGHGLSRNIDLPWFDLICINELRIWPFWWHSAFYVHERSIV